MSTLFSNKNQFNNYYNNLNNINIETGYNALEDSEKIILTTKNNEIRKNLFIINTNSRIKEKIDKKEDIAFNIVKKISNTGMGNCYFKAISQFFTNTESFHIYYRKKVCERIDNKKNIDQVKYPYIYGNNNTWMTYNENFYKIFKTGTYIGEYEIINTCLEFRCNTYMFIQIRKR